MRSVIRIALLGLAAGVCPGLARPAAAQSDSCASATPVVAGTYAGTNAGATPDGLSPCEAGPVPDVWYRYTAPQTGFVRFDTCGSSWDTVLSVHGGCPGAAANTIACDDDSLCGLASAVDVPVTAGQTYHVRVAGFGGQTGPFTLNVGSVFSGSDACWE